MSELLNNLYHTQSIFIHRDNAGFIWLVSRIRKYNCGKDQLPMFLRFKHQIIQELFCRWLNWKIMPEQEPRGDVLAQWTGA
jgi:hypothetical protein